MTMADIAIAECVEELRAACRRPIDLTALDTVVGWLRPQFDQILDCAEGRARWADHGQQMRDNGRHLGALADFFGHQSNAPVVSLAELAQAFDLVRGACRVRVDRVRDGSVAAAERTGEAAEGDSRGLGAG
jgi:hypothetical protein